MEPDTPPARPRLLWVKSPPGNSDAQSGYGQSPWKEHVPHRHRESLPREAENIRLRKSHSVWLLRTNEIQMNDDDWKGTSGRISGVKRIQRQENI